MDKQLSFETTKEIKSFIHSNESNMYGGVNENNEKVVIFLQKGEGMDIHTYQLNGWIRVTSFDADGIKTDESFNGRWNKSN